nr:hypothetical protein [Tanacetum cinerariifolium]
KLLKDLKELAEYDQSTNTDRPIFLNDNHLENSSEENVVSKTNQEPPQDSNIHQLIEEGSVEVPEEQKQKMEDMMFDLVEICHHKQFLCIHDDIDNLIESTLDSKLISINSQRLDKKDITPETESDEVTESNAENLLPIPSKCEVTLEDEIECNMPAKDVCSPVFTTFSNPLFKDNDDLDSSDDESLPDEDIPAEEFKINSNSLFDEDEINSDKLDPHSFNVEYDFVESLLNRDTFIDFSSKFDFSEELNAEIADTIIESIPLLPIRVQNGNSQQEEIDIVTSLDDVLPPSVENDNDDFDLLLGETDLFLSDDSIPPDIENVADDPEGDVRFLEELLINDSILSHESFDSNFEENLSIPRPPPEPPDVESFFDLKPDMIGEEISDKLNEDKCFDPGREINVSTKIEDDDYFPFMFVIRFFLPYFIFPEVFPLLLSAESEDTIFDPGISN